jgi:hypothetical protein
MESFRSFDPLVGCQDFDGKPRLGRDHPVKTSSPPLRQGRLHPVHALRIWDSQYSRADLHKGEEPVASKPFLLGERAPPAHPVSAALPAMSWVKWFR